MVFTSTTSAQTFTTVGDGLAEPTFIGAHTPVSVSSISGATPIQGSPVSNTAFPQSVGSSWGDVLQSDISKTLFNRLMRLASASDGWSGPGSKALRQQSISNFLEFWKIVRTDAVEPELALAPDGSLHAEWFNSSREHLDIQFGATVAVFGLFSNKSIVEGAEKPELIAPFLKSHPSRPLRWPRK